ncbi:stress response translation initiation inhibitor YciH [Nanoarchaeota archaeon NZ13-N]|uniref:Translation initiation factor n=1 Tax=Candidatus Nanoclepta minutus TaxID=1940235 RepID=A0A397WP52_9ARCH|nr:MAG: stress response translation initiation inhibitor YciH [Nanoarchaeota archaeon NZ13-N]RIB35357.1 MAG: translation initiation factor [Candidatus Nanoclepta minutus]
MKKKLISGFPSDIKESIELIEREAQKIVVTTEKRSYGKTVTLISGIEEEVAKGVLKNLKKKLGCGGTYKNGAIELQGDHRDKIKKILVEEGFKEENIEVE